MKRNIWSKLLISTVVLSQFAALGSIVYAEEPMNEEPTNNEEANIETSSLLRESKVGIKTNASSVTTHSNLALTLELVNENGVIPQGTQYVVKVSSDAIDFDSINFDDTTLMQYFVPSKDVNEGTITLTLNKDIIGEGSSITLNLSAMVTGVVGASYQITGEQINTDGSVVPITVVDDMIHIAEGPSGVYGEINAFWGKGPNELGNFIGKSSADDSTGIFSRQTNRIDIFGEFNTTHRPWSELVDAQTGKWVVMTFTYDSEQTLDPSSIVLVNEGTGASVPYTTVDDGSSTQPIVTIDEMSGQFKVKILSNSIMGDSKNTDSLMIGYSTTIKDSSLTYQNNMYLHDETGDEKGRFELYSLFSEAGTSLVFPTITGEDQTFTLGEIDATNGEEILKQVTSALDTNDGTLSADNISLDLSQVDFDTVGTYPVVYKAINSQEMIAAKTYNVTLVAAPEPEVAAPITVKYVDEAGNDLLPEQVHNGNVGDVITVVSEEITGWTVKEQLQRMSNLMVFTDQPQTVLFVYTQDPIVAEDPTPETPKPETPAPGATVNNTVTVKVPAQSSKVTTTRSSKLPDTGTEEQPGFAWMGSMLLTSVWAFILSKKYKK